MPGQTIRIGCYSAFWGDSVHAAAQMVMAEGAELDYLVADYLAEVTMGLLARRSRSNKTKKPGCIDEMVQFVVKPLLSKLIENGTKLITNAGGLDPVLLKSLIEAEAERQGLSDQTKVAAVWNDDLTVSASTMSRNGEFQPFSPFNDQDGSTLEKSIDPESKNLLSLTVYTGAAGIAEALRDGANIVVTGRVVDSALVTGPLAHEFGLDFSGGSNLTELATTALAGHIIECGAQCCGGNFTDWRHSAFSENGGWSNMGYGIVEFDRNDHCLSFNVTKTKKSGGIVSVLSVAEQMLYEVLDPAHYLLPDVCLDMTQVTLKQAGPNTVRVQGAQGKPPPARLKCTAVSLDDYRITGELVIAGEEARDKAQALGHAILKRAKGVLAFHGHDTFKDTRVELMGSEELFGKNSRMLGTREVTLRITAVHPDSKALLWLALEFAQAATSTAPAITGGGSGRVAPTPMMYTTSALLSREQVPVHLIIGKGGEKKTIPSQKTKTERYDIKRQSSLSTKSAIASQDSRVFVPLIRLAVGRSGDKGDNANIAIIARSAKYLDLIQAQVTEESIRQALGHFLTTESVVVRYDVPGIAAVNFVVSHCLGGGGLAGIQIDRQAKTYAQICLSAIQIRIPAGMLALL